MYVVEDDKESLLNNMQLDLTRTGSGGNGGSAVNVFPLENDLH